MDEFPVFVVGGKLCGWWGIVVGELRSGEKVLEVGVLPVGGDGAMVANGRVILLC